MATKEERKGPPIERKIVSAATGEAVVSGSQAAGATPGGKKGSARGLRIAAAVLWALAILAEAAAILMLNKTIYLPGENLTTWLIVALAVDLVLVVIGSQLWKKANRIDPASKKNKIKFWLWNNLGVIVSIVAFLPIIVVLLNNKNLDPKTKRLVSIVAAVALALGVATSYDWNPASQEDLAQAQEQAETLRDGQVFWTTWGRRHHLYEDCSSLSRSATLFFGTMDEAFDAGRAELCKFCEPRANAGEVAVLSEQAREALPEGSADEPPDEAEAEQAA